MTCDALLPARLMTLEEAKVARIGWFEFWSAATGKHFILPCVVKDCDVDGYTAIDNTCFGHYCVGCCAKSGDRITRTRTVRVPAIELVTCLRSAVQ